MKWNKKGKIFDPTTYDDGIKREFMKTHSQCVSVLEFDNFLRVFFSCRPENDIDGQAKSYTTYLDLDKNLKDIIKVSERPVMELGNLGAFDEFAIYPTSVIKNKDKIHMYYAGWTRLKSVPFNTSIGIAVSKNNGHTFERLFDGPIISSSQNDPFVISGPKVRIFDGKWYMFYISGTRWILSNKKPEIIYKIKLAVSDDGIHWEKTKNNIISDKLNVNECQAGPDVFEYNGLYHMYFVYREGINFREIKGRGYKIGYAYSEDLINWKRCDEIAGIDYSEVGWDSKMHHYPHIFKMGNKHYMFYNGNEFGKYGFGLAELDENN